MEDTLLVQQNLVLLDGDEDIRMNDSDDFSSAEEEAPEEVERLSWRMDPEESHSDWTIEIRSTGRSSVATYHVHKSVLAVGSKKSEYFQRLFRNRCFSETMNSKSCIELEPLAADAFPIFLDYLYSVNDELKINTANSAALHYMGQYFEARRLRCEAQRFWKTDLSVANCGVYFSHAELFCDSKIRKAVITDVTFHIFEIFPDSHILEVSNPKLWIDVFGSLDWMQKDSDTIAKHCSILIAEFCTMHQGKLDAKTFEALTNPLIAIDEEVAERLMEIEVHILSGEKIKKRDELTTLQQRCIDALAQEYDHFDTSKANIHSLATTYSPLVLSYWLARTVKYARRDKRGAKRAAKTASLRHKRPKREVRFDPSCKPPQNTFANPFPV